MDINGIEYTFLIAIDITHRESLSYECWRGQNLVLKVSKDDKKRQFIFSQFLQELPLSLVEHIVKASRKELGDFKPFTKVVRKKSDMDRTSKLR